MKETRIQNLQKEDVNEYVRIWTQCYPGVGIDSSEKLKQRQEAFLKVMETDAANQWYSVTHKNRVVGGFRAFVSPVRVHQQEMETLAVGSIFVALDYKKQGFARQIMAYVHDELAQEKNCAFTMLYPFNSKFYRNFGYGSGAPIYSYTLSPTQCPDSPQRKQVKRAESASDLEVCYQRYRLQQNGLSQRNHTYFQNILDQAGNNVYVYKENERVEGYLIFKFQSANQNNFLENTLVIDEFVFLNSGALQGILGFLHNLKDQLGKIVLNSSCADLYVLLHHAVQESSEIVHPVYQVSHRVSLGIMYRILNREQFIRQLAGAVFGPGKISVKFQIDDDYIKEKTDTLMADFENGRVDLGKAVGEKTVVTLTTSNFTELMMGSVSARTLFELGRLTISKEENLDSLNQIFATLKKPLNLDRF